MFHYALNPGGFLFLGTSETVGEYAELFSTMDRQSKLFARRNDISGGNRAVLKRLDMQTREDGNSQRLPLASSGVGKSLLREMTEQELLEHFAQPPCWWTNGVKLFTSMAARQVSGTCSGRGGHEHRQHGSGGSAAGTDQRLAQSGSAESYGA
jgi:hypothetical protein